MNRSQRQQPQKYTSYIGLVRRLAYGYTLSGALKSVTDVEDGSTTSYEYDAAGQVEGVKDGAAPGALNYAHSIRRRAWGAVRSMAYGNGLTLSLGYNARLLPESFEVSRPQAGSQAVMSGRYGYYGDGRARFSADRVDDRFDRAYSYDPLGRLEEAYTGGQARAFAGLPAGAPAQAPYRQSYTYDAFDRLTSRTAKIWSRDDAYAASYATATGRNPAWTYDAAGNVRQGDGLSHTYDAAGRPRSVTGGGVVVTQVRDGDGQALRREVKRLFPAGPTEVSYQARSRALGGAAVAELDGAGRKVKGYVRLGGEMLATREQGEAAWHHRDPVTGSAGASYSNAAFEATSEPDPMGANLGREDPFDSAGGGIGIAKPEPGRPSLYAGGGWGAGGEPRCYLDGLELEDCEWAGELMARGAAELDPGYEPAASAGVLPTYREACTSVDGGKPDCRPYVSGYSALPDLNSLGRTPESQDSSIFSNDWQKLRYKGVPFSPCAKKILGDLFNGSALNVNDLRVRIGIPQSIKDFATITPAAVTIGNTIYIDAGFINQYDASTVDGLAGLAHEAWHGLQFAIAGKDRQKFNYLWDSLKKSLSGKDAYRDNEYEKEAYEVQGTIQDYIRRTYGDRPCETLGLSPKAK